MMEKCALKTQCEQEIQELHQFFEDWFAGKVDQTEEEFSRFSRVLCDEFLIVSPNGSRTGRERLLEEFRQGYGKYANRGMEIWVESPEVRYETEELCLMTYEEWQKLGGKMNTRLSTALFRADEESSPNGVKWVHVHETGLRSGDEQSRLSEN